MENPYKYLENDNEPNLVLRKLRNLLGYGCGWTFWGALWEWGFPKFWLIVTIASVIWLSLHVKIIVMWR